MKNNMLAIKAASYLGVHKLIERNDNEVTMSIYHMVGITKDQDGAPAEKIYNSRINTTKIISQTPITHELHLSGNTLTNSEQHVVLPNQDVCVMAYILAGSDIDRPNHSRIIIYNDDLYYCLTWTDVLGNTKHAKTAGLRRQEAGRYVAYLQLAPLEHYDKVMQVLLEQFPDLYAISK